MCEVCIKQGFCAGADYKINLIVPASITDGDFDKFRTSLKEVLSFIKYSQDEDRLEEILKADEGFRHMGRTEVDVLNACVGAKLAMEKGEEAKVSVPNKRKVCLFGDREDETDCGRKGKDFDFAEKH